jgi:hypothetical protein
VLFLVLLALLLDLALPGGAKASRAYFCGAMMAQIHAPIPSLTDDYYVHIGAALHRWATLEYQLMTIIWEALKLDNKTGRVLTVGMNCPTLTGILRNLHRRWVTDKAITSDIRELCNDIKKTVPFRNYLAHGIWTADPKHEKVTPWLNYMKDGDERILPGAEQVTPQMLADFASVVQTLNIRASDLLKRIRSAPPPLLDTSDEQNPPNGSAPSQNQ